MMWPLQGCRVVGGPIYSLLLREGNPNSRTPFKHSPTLPCSADDPRTRVLDGAEGGTVSVGRAGVSDSLLTAVLVLFPARLLVLQNTQSCIPRRWFGRVAKTIPTASMHCMRYASRHFKFYSGSKNYITTYLKNV